MRIERAKYPAGLSGKSGRTYYVTRIRGKLDEDEDAILCVGGSEMGQKSADEVVIRTLQYRVESGKQAQEMLKLFDEE